MLYWVRFHPFQCAILVERLVRSWLQLSSFQHLFVCMCVCVRERERERSISHYNHSNGNKVLPHFSLMVVLVVLTLPITKKHTVKFDNDA